MDITELPALIAALPAERRARFERIFDADLVQGECRIPASMRGWTLARFGSLADVERQQIVRVTNRVTWEGAIFNPLRTRRPMLSRPAAPPPDGDDVFADPLRCTAEDVFGRISGAHCITTGNIARWDSQCSVLIFNEPDPLAFTREHLRDYFSTSLRWAAAAHKADPQAVHLVWMWNGGTAGGASIPHAHAQLGLGRRAPYAMVEGLRRAAQQYHAETGADYFGDLCAVHDDAGLGFRAAGLRGFVNLSAARPRDTWIIAPAFDEQLADALHDVLRALIERAGVRGFDAGIIMAPLFTNQTSGSTEKPGVSGNVSWAGFPVIARIVDRGRPDALSSDVGAMDIFAQRVIADDPYHTRAALGL